MNQIRSLPAADATSLVDAQSKPTSARAEIFGFSPLFGVFKEANAAILGAIPGYERYRRVLFEGEEVERVRAVFPELQGRLDAQFIRVLNELISLGASDLPTVLGDCASFRPPWPRRRKIALPKRGGR